MMISDAARAAGHLVVWNGASIGAARLAREKPAGHEDEASLKTLKSLASTVASLFPSGTAESEINGLIQ